MQAGEVVRLGDAPIGALIRWEDEDPDDVLDVMVADHRDDSEVWTSISGVTTTYTARNRETLELLPTRTYPPVAGSYLDESHLDSEGMSTYDAWNSDAQVRLLTMPW